MNIRAPRCPHNSTHPLDVRVDAEADYAEWHCGRCTQVGSVASIHLGGDQVRLVAVNPRSMSDHDRANWARFLASVVAS